MAEGTERSSELSPERVFAPIPKRRRGNQSDSDESSTLSPPRLAHQLTSSELTKAAEELLDHYDNVDRSKNMRSRSQGQDKGATLGILTPGDSSSTLALDQAIHESAWSNLAEHDCQKEGCYDSGNRYMAEDDRLSDDYERQFSKRGGGKKRKVPASALQGKPVSGNREEDIGPASYDHDLDDSSRRGIEEDCGNDHASRTDCCEYHSGGTDGSDLRYSKSPQTKRKMTRARKAQIFHARLLQARKSQVLGLHGDASVCLSQTKGKTSSLPSQEELESLSRALEYASISGWEGDRVGNGAGIWEGQTSRARVKMLAAIQSSLLGTVIQDADSEVEGQDTPSMPVVRLKEGRALDRWRWMHRKAVPRKGWIPEGSFEFEKRSAVSNVMARSLQDLNLLRTKVTQLLTLTLTSKPMAKLLTSRAQTSSTTHLPLPSPRSQTPAQKFSFGPLINPKAIESTPGGSSPPRTPPKAKEPGQTTAMRSSTQRGVEEDKRTAPVGQKKIYTAEQADRIRNELKAIIDKTVAALSKAKNPVELEALIKQRSAADLKFSFLKESDPNHPYYKYMLNAAKSKLQQGLSSNGIKAKEGRPPFPSAGSPSPSRNVTGPSGPLVTPQLAAAAAAKGPVPTSEVPARSASSPATAQPTSAPGNSPAPRATSVPSEPAANSNIGNAADVSIPAATKPINTNTSGKKVNTNPDVKIEASYTEADYIAPPSNKKKPNKKKPKKTSFANASNPHHVKNYVPSRRPVGTANESTDIPDLFEKLFFPPPNRFLAARPPRPRSDNSTTTTTTTTDHANKATSLTPNNALVPASFSNSNNHDPTDPPPDDEYVCCFCEYDLFFGSEGLMDKGIRRRQALLEKRNRVSEKAKNVIEGKGMGKLGKSGNKRNASSTNNNTNTNTNMNTNTNTTNDTANTNGNGLVTNAAASAEPYPGEEGCPGGDACVCNEIRADKAAAAAALLAEAREKPLGEIAPSSGQGLLQEVDMTNRSGEGGIPTLRTPDMEGFLIPSVSTNTEPLNQEDAPSGVTSATLPSRLSSPPASNPAVIGTEASNNSVAPMPNDLNQSGSDSSTGGPKVEPETYLEADEDRPPLKSEEEGVSTTLESPRLFDIAALLATVPPVDQTREVNAVSGSFQTTSPDDGSPDVGATEGKTIRISGITKDVSERRVGRGRFSRRIDVHRPGSGSLSLRDQEAQVGGEDKRSLVVASEKQGMNSVGGERDQREGSAVEKGLTDVDTDMDMDAVD